MTSKSSADNLLLDSSRLRPNSFRDVVYLLALVGTFGLVIIPLLMGQTLLTSIEKTDGIRSQATAFHPHNPQLNSIATNRPDRSEIDHHLAAQKPFRNPPNILHEVGPGLDAFQDIDLVSRQRPPSGQEQLDKIAPLAETCILPCSHPPNARFHLSLRPAHMRRLKGTLQGDVYPIECRFHRRGFGLRPSTLGWLRLDGWFECPAPKEVNCTGHTTNRWDIKLNITEKHTIFHVYYPVRSEQRPFQITTLHWNRPREQLPSHVNATIVTNESHSDSLAIHTDRLLQVVSFFLPTELHRNSCNRIYCRVKRPDGTIYYIDPIIGDTSFAFCPVPKEFPLEKPHDWLISLAYHSNFVTPWAPIAPAITWPVEEASRLSICTIVKQEGPYLHEWIEYHRMLGVDRFIIYDNNHSDKNSKNDDVMDRVLSLYQGYVVKVPWKFRHSQTEALTDCILRFGPSAEWMAFIDVDEFLVPMNPDVNSLLELLESYDGRNVTLLADWLLFGPCGDSKPPVDALAMDYCKKTQAHPETIHKPIFTAKSAVGVRAFGPHYIRLHSDIGLKGHSPATKISDQLRVFHYRYRSWPEFRQKRMGDTAGRILHRNEEDVRRFWEEGLRDPVDVDRQMNQIIRFRSELKDRLKRMGWIRS